MDVIKEKWEEILYTVKLEHELTDVSFDTWLKPLKVHSFEKNGSANMLYILIPAEQQPAFVILRRSTPFRFGLPLRKSPAWTVPWNLSFPKKHKNWKLKRQPLLLI